MSKTKIVIFQLKEIIYTAIFVGLGILLILLLIFMFWHKNDSTDVAAKTQYKAGVYTSTIVLNDTSLNIEVVVDKNHINNVSIKNIDDAITTMFPLLQPSLDDITEQLNKGVAVSKLTLSDESKYTQELLIDGINNALSKATP
ncbi:hypothetical protein [Anaeromicropila herbilytica]|uniref:FMN-binding domain-containing protein n=1 Tax=Anaeromicropila herbilytica TaxID=2785025 RepID=A0A7R7IFH5_9FIRM|nr:hypothetical protein [Anaeromicropila herbilytica]BCN32153.1 hypothetical protein bsdtb5_34480 [Anaeromicropila herbilytica]